MKNCETIALWILMLTDAVISEKIREHFEVFWFALFLSLSTLYFAWKQGFFFKPEPFYVRIRGWDVLKAFLYFIIAQVILVPALLVVILSLITHQDPNVIFKSLKGQGWVSIASVFGGFAAVWLAYLSIPEPTRHAIWGHSKHWIKNLFIGMLTWFISFPFTLALSQLVAIVVLFFSHEQEVDQVAVRHLKSVLSDKILFGAIVASVIFIVPLVEEFLFRGLLQTWFKEKLIYQGWAIVFTSIIFALFHYSTSQGVTNIELLFSLFILSCFLGFLYERQRSLWAPIGLHATFNAITILMIIKSE